MWCFLYSLILTEQYKGIEGKCPLGINYLCLILAVPASVWTGAKKAFLCVPQVMEGILMVSFTISATRLKKTENFRVMQVFKSSLAQVRTISWVFLHFFFSGLDSRVLQAANLEFVHYSASSFCRFGKE